MADNNTVTQTLVIETLGNFSVRVGDKILSDDSPREGQVWRLFKYIITNRAASVPTEKLIDLLWPDGSIDNPIKALYTLVYRLRSILNEHFNSKQEFIIFQHNSYIWNKNAAFWLDAEEFERLFQQANEPNLNNKTRIELFHKAFKLYGGDYLAESYSEGWVFSTTNYYKRLYTSIIMKLSELCAAENDYSSIVNYCEKAIEFDPFDENLHATLINALVSLGLLSQALAHYDYIAAILKKELGVRPGETLQTLYREIHQQAMSSSPTNMSKTLKSLGEDISSANEAFFCEMDTFKHIYRLQTRAIKRSGQSFYLALITLTTPKSDLPDEDQLAESFALLKHVVIFGLRRGDVVTQPSKSQLLVLLPAASVDICETVMNRLKEKFYSSHKGDPIRFTFVCNRIEPLEDNDLLIDRRKKSDL